MFLKILKYIAYTLVALVPIFAIWWFVTDHRSEFELQADYCSYLFASDSMVAEANEVWGSQRGTKGEDYIERSEWLVEQENLLLDLYKINTEIQDLAYSKGWDDVCYDPDLEFMSVIIEQPLVDRDESFIELK